MNWRHDQYLKAPYCSAICMSGTSRLTRALHGWEVALHMNRCLAKSGQQKTIPCHRNGGKPFLGELFLNGRLDFVESIKNYGAVCEFPLAPGHDMQMKGRKRGMKTLFIILFL